MKEARIILMDYSNVSKETFLEISKTFGGATVYKGQGFWQGLSEDIQIVDIAYEPSFEHDTKLYDIVDHYRLNAGQQEVYLRYGNGNVQMVSAQSCMDNGEFDWETLRKAIREPADDLGDVIDTH